MNIPLDQANGTDGNPVEVLVGKRLRMIRTNRGFSMRTLADRSGLNINTLSLIENVKTSPSVSTLQLLATALDVPVPLPGLPQQPDLRGLRIRTLPSALEQEMVRELGGSPTPLPWSEVYYALSAGLLDGTKNSVQDVVGMKLHEHVRFLLVDRHSYMGAMWWYSEKQWQALPEELKP